MTITRWILSLLTLLVAGCAASMADYYTASRADYPPNRWITVPQTLDRKEVLWEGPLQSDVRRALLGPLPIEELREYQKTHGLRETGQLDDATWKEVINIWMKVARNPPILSIGRPQIWPLSKVMSFEKMSPLIQARLKEADFYLVQLFCSFRPVRRETQIEWARFEIHLFPDLVGRQPIALDLIPMEITKEVKRDAKFTLAPTLKFHEVVEVQTANIEWGIEYQELQPVIMAAGLGEPTPTWTYYAVKGIGGVNGGKGMYLIVEAPKGMESAYARLKLEAQISAEGLRSWWTWIWQPLEQKERDLIVRLW